MKTSTTGEISFKPGLELMSPALEKIKKEIDCFIYLAYSQAFFHTLRVHAFYKS